MFYQPCFVKLIHSSTLISLVLPSGTQPKPFSHPCTINLFLPWSVDLSSTSLLSLPPRYFCSLWHHRPRQITQKTVYLVRFYWHGSPLDSALSFFPLFLHQNTENIIPIMPSHLWCSARFSSRAPTFHPLHYSTQLSHQILLNRPSSIRRWHPFIHILSKQLLWLHKSSFTCG